MSSCSFGGDLRLDGPQQRQLTALTLPSFVANRRFRSGGTVNDEFGCVVLLSLEQNRFRGAKVEKWALVIKPSFRASIRQVMRQRAVRDWGRRRDAGRTRSRGRLRYGM
jgi:hypothetical protein